MQSSDGDPPLVALQRGVDRLERIVAAKKMEGDDE
jgi:hypothetical protein